MARILHLGMLATLVMYVLAGEVAGPRQPQAVSPLIYSSLAIVACVVAVIALLVRSRLLRPPDDSLQVAPDPGQPANIARWRLAQILSYMLAEAIALFGFVLRFLGKPLADVLPFYLAGAVLMLIFTPRLPANLNSSADAVG